MATTTAVSPEAPEPAKVPINHFGRITGMFFSPKATFEQIARRPSWLAPVLLMTIVGLVVGVAINQRVDWRDVASKRIEESPRAANLSAEQKEQQISIGAKVSPYFAYGFGLIGPILLVVIVATVMWGAYNLLGGANANYGVSLAIVSHAFVVTVVSSLLFILILYLKPIGTVDLENPVAANLGALVPDGSAKWLEKLASAIDVFSFWVMALIGIGYAAFNPKKLKTGSAIAICFGVWAAYEVVRVGISFIFS